VIRTKIETIANYTKMGRIRLKATSIWHTNRIESICCIESIPFLKWNLIFCQPPQKNDAKYVISFCSLLEHLWNHQWW